ncbi:DUF2971 domain-containing protein [Pseudoxanthomonas sp. LH2527]|uniref:DUF2971 domain-containing protein n=1 Tax=Pseudoxanthomonas sp. LH2527 TaxID=2923249 RepID=UPI001F131112
MLTNQTLRWSRRAPFNDPHDLQVGFSTAVPLEEVRDRALDLMWDRVICRNWTWPRNQMGALLEATRAAMLKYGRLGFREAMAAGLEPSIRTFPNIVERFSADVIKHFETIKVLCLSPMNDNAAMWAYYADDHRGLVLEFATIPELDSVYRVAQRVTYADEPPPLLEPEAWAQLLAGNIRLDTKLADRLMLIKHTHWAHEREWRIVTGEGRFPNEVFEDIRFGAPELVGVYFGVRAERWCAELMPLIRARYPDAKLWQAEKGMSFGLKFSPIE